MVTRTILLVCLYLFVSQPAHATFLPPNEINYEALKFYPEGSDMTKAEFDAIIAKIQRIYEPIVLANGGRLNVRADWQSDELNASAMQFFGNWYVNMYGGLARFSLMTADGFAMVFCHELGHHLAGFTFGKRGGPFGGVWAANEGQSDYFAAHHCSRKIWQDEPEINATFRDKIPQEVATACDNTWQTKADRDLCYRINAAGASLAASLHALRKQKDPNNTDPDPAFDTPDPAVVGNTDDSHPRAQCRMDTTYAASLCTAKFDDNVIPGKEKQDPHGMEAEQESAQYSCTDSGGFQDGLRPNCWYFPRL